MIRTLPALILLVGFVAACDSDDDSKAEATATATATTSATPTPTPTPTPTATPTPAPTPSKAVLTPKPKPKPKVLSACASIWKAGATLPAGYAGCPTVAGEEAAAPSPCNNGGTWATYSNSTGRFVAKLGGSIIKRNPDVDGDYESTYEGCTGEG